MQKVTPIELAFTVFSVLAGSAIRIGLTFYTPLWFDEILSIQNALSLSSLQETVLSLHQDNNHILNSVWIFLLGSRAHPEYCRMISLGLGIGLVFVASMCARKLAGKRAACITATIFSWSFILNVYASEARGYSALLFFHSVHFCSMSTLKRRKIISSCISLFG